MQVLAILLLASSAFAAEDTTISKQRLFQVSCERGLMSFFLEHGNHTRPNKEFYQGAKKACREITEKVTATEWRVMTSPTESGCSTAVRMLAENNSGVPEITQLFASYCYNH